jgi:hypothetical protein
LNSEDIRIRKLKFKFQFAYSKFLFPLLCALFRHSSIGWFQVTFGMANSYTHSFNLNANFIWKIIYTYMQK